MINRNAVLMIFSLIALTSCNKYNYNNLLKCQDIYSEYKLFVLSSSNCGYCAIASDKLTFYKDNKNMKIVFIEFDKPVDKEFNECCPFYIYLTAEECNDIEDPKAYPLLFLFDNNDNKIWSKKGWFDENIIQINNKINTSANQVNTPAT